MCIKKVPTWKINEEEVSKEPYQWRSRYLSRAPTTDGKEISKERNSDKREEGAIFYSL